MSQSNRNELSRRQFLKGSGIAVGSLAFSSVLAGCRVPGAVEAPAVVSSGPKGKIVFGNAEPPSSANWDDHKVDGLVDWQVASLVHDRLWEYDENKNLLPRLATEWEYVDPTTLDVTLREGVKYHDGEPFNAEHVKAVVERVANDTSIAKNANWVPATVDIKGDYHVQIITEQPFAPLIPVLATTTMLPKHFLEEPERFNTENIGTGSYRFVEYKGSDVVLEANEGYWDGAPNIETVIFRYIEDWNARTNALLAGDVDVLTRCSSEQLALVEDKNDFYVYENSPAFGIIYVYEHKSEPMLSQKFRQAMMYAFDRKTVIEEVMGGVGVFSDNILPTSTLFHEPLSEKYPYDPGKAKQLLDESGLGDVTLKMATASLVPHQKEIDLAFVQYLEDIGVEVEMTNLEVGQFRSTFTEYDISLNTMGTATGDPDSLLSVYTLPVGEVFGLQNNPAIKDFPPLNEAQRVATDADERQERVTEAAEWLWDFQPIMEMSDELWPFILHDRVKGYRRANSLGEALLRNAKVET